MQTTARLWRLGGALLALSMAACLHSVTAQAADPAPLFAGQEPLAFTLSMPVRRLVSRARSKPVVAGTLSYVGADGATVKLDVEVTTRGKSRLEYCRFPPLSLDFKRKQVKGSLFAGQNKLKLVTRCRNGHNFEQYLALERVLYGVYAQVDEVAFRTRTAQVRYVDTERDDVEEAPAFFIEHEDGVAARLGMRAVDIPRLQIADIQPKALAVLELFQFMIGNTDWSALAPSGDEKDCCHNGAVLAASDAGTGRFVVVPYDFDQAGLINTVYAAPNERLPIRSVRQRLYRGFCATNDHLVEAIGAFDAARPAIESLFNDPAIDDKARADALAYLRDSYAIIDDPGERQDEIIEHCRGR